DRPEAPLYPRVQGHRAFHSGCRAGLSWRSIVRAAGLFAALPAMYRDLSSVGIAFTFPIFAPNALISTRFPTHPRSDPMNTAALIRICAGLLAVGAFTGSAEAQQQQKSSAPPAATQKKNGAPPQQKTTPPAAVQQKKPPSPTDQAVLLGQFGEWGAYR